MRLNAAAERAIAQLRGPIARSSIAGAAIRAAGMTVMFLQAVLLARFLGAENFGVVTLLLAILQIAAALVLGGLGSLAVAELPARTAQGWRNVAQRFHRYGFGRIFGASIVASPILLLAVWFLTGATNVLLSISLLVSVPAMAGILLSRGIALGLGRPITAQLPGELIRPILLVAALTGVWTFGALDTTIFMVLFAITAWAAFGIGRLVQETSAQSLFLPSDQTHASEWSKAARPFLWLHLLTILQFELATLMLGLFASPEEVGLFQPIARIAMVMLIPIQALGLAFNPRIARLHAENNQTEIAHLARKWTFYATGMMVLGGLLIGLVATPLLSIFGPEFVGNHTIIWVLIGARILHAACGPGFELLTMTGHANLGARAQTYGLAFEAAAAASLIPHFGMAGAALAIVIGMIIRCALLCLWSRQKLGLGITSFWSAKRGRASAA